MGDLRAERAELDENIKRLQKDVADDPKKRNRRGPAWEKSKLQKEKYLKKCVLRLQVVETQLEYLDGGGGSAGENVEFVAELDRLYEQAWRRMEVYTLRHRGPPLTSEMEDELSKHEKKIKELKPRREEFKWHE